MPPTEGLTLEQSVEQVLHDREPVIRRFYDHLLANHPEIRRYFEQVNLEHQAALLTMALVTVEGHYSRPNPATQHYLKVLGYRHCLNGIPPDAFPKFRDSLVCTLRDYHVEDWTESLEDAWHRAFNGAIATMLEGYEGEFIY